MKGKASIILCILLVGALCSQSFSSIAVDNNENEQKIIRVALLDATIPSFNSPENVKQALDCYEWEVENQSYIFDVDWITDGQIRRGRLSRQNYDVFIIPGIGKEFHNIFNVISARWKNQIRKFVENGGGYVGMCGGANMAVSSHVNPNERGYKLPTFWEWCMRRSCLGLVEALSYQDMSDPYASTVLWKNPSRIGISAYIWYNLTNEGAGISANLTINTSHPIFYDYPYDYRLMRWNSGPALIPYSENVTVLAWYPSVEFSGIEGDPKTTIHSWKYVGPFSGEFYKQGGLDFWDKDKILETNISGKPAAIADTYGDGRVVIYGPHPEHPVYFDEHIVESDDTNRNFLWFKERLYKKNFQQENVSYNWWIVRRSAAWTAKIPDSDLPPIVI